MKRPYLVFLFLGLVITFASGASPGTYTVLYSFTGGADGDYPQGRVVLDQLGNLYGTTSPKGNGGGPCNTIGGCGTVWELTPSHGGWIETTLYDFCSLPSCSDGTSPWGDLILDSAGNLYGTTLYGGSSGCLGLGCGTVFELMPNGNGGWKESILYTFSGTSDGVWPYSGVIFDKNGNLYGTTLYGGSSGCGGLGCGTVFELMPNGNG